jgi:hypothetical protein
MRRSLVTWPVSDCTVSYRPVLSSERAHYGQWKQIIVSKERIRIKSAHAPKGEPDTKMNWSTDCRPQDKLNSSSETVADRTVLPSTGAFIYSTLFLFTSSGTNREENQKSNIRGFKSKRPLLSLPFLHTAIYSFLHKNLIYIKEMQLNCKIENSFHR